MHPYLKQHHSFSLPHKKNMNEHNVLIFSIPKTLNVIGFNLGGLTND